MPGDLEDTPVWKLTGGWKPAALARLLPAQAEAAAKGRPCDLTKLSARLPDSVSVYLRQSDYFPLRIDYCRGGSKSAPKCLVGLRFSDVNLNGPIDSSQFLFSPQNLDYSDRTDDFVRGLGLTP